MVSLIAAVSNNWVIGNGPDIPWHLPADFAYFKKITTGHPIIMGRTTFESIGKPLPERQNIVVTRNTEYQVPEGVVVACSVEDAIAVADTSSGEVFIIGGAQIYKDSLDNGLIDKVYITYVDVDAEGDVIFPGAHLESFVRVSHTDFKKDEKNTYDMTFAVYERHHVVSGKELATQLEEELKVQVESLVKKPTLGIYVVGHDKATEMYVKKKQALAERVGAGFTICAFEDDVEEEALAKHIQNHLDDFDGVVVQLPLPKHIDRDVICGLVPPEKDPDFLNPESIESFKSGKITTFPPVVGAIDYILKHYQEDVADKRVLVIGKGKLVGAPAALYFQARGSQVISVDKYDREFSALAIEADIIVSGAGSPNVVTEDMVKQGVILFDAGTSGSSGSLVGDIDFECGKKAKLFSRSPGGIGPLTVTMLFKNFLHLASQVDT